MPDEDFKLELIERGEKEPMSIAEARFLARKFLPDILDGLMEISANRENKPSERTLAYKTLLEFATDVAENETKWLSKMSPRMAARLATMNKKDNDASQGTKAVEPPALPSGGPEAAPDKKLPPGK